MLKPTKHTNLKYSVYNVSGSIINIISSNWVITYAELFWALKMEVWKEVKEIALYSISFLYSLWKIDYIKDLDAFKLN